MKKELICLILGVFIISLVVAESINIVAQQRETINQEKNQNDSQGLGQTIRGRVRAGVYTNEQGEQIRVFELAQNRIQLRVRNISAHTRLNITQEHVQNRTKLKAKLSNGRNAEIKIMPDTASETALQRLRLKVCSEEDNCTIELKEVGKGEGNQTRLAYELQRQRHFKLLGLFRIKAQVKAQVDAETGEIIVVKKPWWAFLATEPEE